MASKPNIVLITGSSRGIGAATAIAAAACMTGTVVNCAGGL